MKCSVIICAHTEKRWDALVEAVRSIEKQTIPAHQIIIVIDHNRPMYERAKNAFPKAEVLENTLAQGANDSRNTALSAATGEIVAFIDDDAAADEHWIENLLAGYTEAHIAGVGGAILPDWLSNEPKWLPVEFRWVVGCTYRGLPESPTPVRNLIGCNMSYRLSVVTMLGGFTSGIGHAGGEPRGDDETEFCIRLRQKFPEKTILYKPDAVVKHKVPAMRTTRRYFQYRCSLEGKSKALLSTLVGTKDGLGSERSYTLKILPTGVLHGIRDALRGDVMGLGRSYMIIEGFTITAGAYLLERLKFLLKGKPHIEVPEVLSTN